MTDYGYVKLLKGTTMQAARERVTAELAKEGFGVLTEIDMQAALRKKLDVSFRPYVILGACNPQLAHQALQREPHVGLLLPCNVVVQELDEGVAVSIASPRAMFTSVENPELEALVDEVEERVKRVLGALDG